MNRTNHPSNDNESGDLSRVRPKVGRHDGQATASIEPADRDEHDQTARHDAESAAPVDDNPFADIRSRSTVQGAPTESNPSPSKRDGDHSDGQPVPPVHDDPHALGGEGTNHDVPPIAADTSAPVEPNGRGLSLDSHHERLIQRVLDKDTAESRRELARHFAAELTDDIDRLRADQADLGTREQMDAIRATGWCGWARFFVVASWVVVLIDTLIWVSGGTRLLNVQ